MRTDPPSSRVSFDTLPGVLPPRCFPTVFSPFFPCTTQGVGGPVVLVCLPRFCSAASSSIPRPPAPLCGPFRTKPHRVFIVFCATPQPARFVFYRHGPSPRRTFYRDETTCSQLLFAPAFSLPQTKHPAARYLFLRTRISQRRRLISLIPFSVKLFSFEHFSCPQHEVAANMFPNLVFRFFGDSGPPTMSCFPFISRSERHQANGPLTYLIRPSPSPLDAAG